MSLTMAGYSATPLAKKLGIKPGHRVILMSAPKNFETILAPPPDEVKLVRRLTGDADVMLLFSTAAKDLEAQLPRATGHLVADGGLWVAWPKKASGVATDLSFDVVQKTGLALGLVDNKICAVDETWSGLRFVVRREDRTGWQKRGG